jgi:glycogen debranching enzyme
MKDNGFNVSIKMDP